MSKKNDPDLLSGVKWQPWATVPTDGTEILIAYRGTCVGKAGKTKDESWSSTTFIGERWATAWAPMPKPPVECPKVEDKNE